MKNRRLAIAAALATAAALLVVSAAAAGGNERHGGSDTGSAFRVSGDQLELTTVLPSGGSFPNSVAVHDGLAYVLNAGGAGSVQGFRITGHGLVPIPGSTRTLGLANTTPPNFLTAP